MDNTDKILKACTTDEESYKKIKALVGDLYAERKKLKLHIDLLERAIKSDYDSILITGLELDKPGPEIVYVNDGFTRMTGYSREEVVGKTPRILQGPKTDRAVLDKLKQRLTEGQSFFGHTVNYRKDGSEFINQWDIHPLMNDKGEITHWVSYQHDITERKRSEEKVIDSNMEFDDLTEESKKTLVDLDEQGNIVTSNKAFRDLTGFDDEELKVQKIWDLLSDQYIESFRHRFESFRPSDFDNRIYDLAIINKKGAPVEVKAKARLLKTSDHTIIRMAFENRSLQKKIMALLSKRNVNFKRVFDNARDFNYKLISNEEGNFRFKYVSESFTKVTGIAYEHAGDISIKDLLHSDDQEKFLHHIKLVRGGKPNTEQFRIRGRKGGYTEVIDYAKPEWNNDRTAVEAVKGAVSIEISSEKTSQ